MTKNISANKEAEQKRFRISGNQIMLGNKVVDFIPNDNNANDNCIDESGQAICVYHLEDTERLGQSILNLFCYETTGQDIKKIQKSLTIDPDTLSSVVYVTPGVLVLEFQEETLTPDLVILSTKTKSFKSGKPPCTCDYRYGENGNLLYLQDDGVVDSGIRVH